MLIIGHVSVGAVDVEEGVRFYLDLFAPHAKRVPAPGLLPPPRYVAWLQLGQIQFHIAQRVAMKNDIFDHFAIATDDRELFQRIYRKAKAEGFLRDIFAHHLCALPNGEVQLYIHDPAGNSVEINYPRLTDLDPEVQAAARSIAETYPQPPDAGEASVFDSLDAAPMRVARA